MEKSASQQEIKQAYYKLELRLHPDKNPGDEEAMEKFQQWQKVIGILGDEEKQADLAGDVVQNLCKFFRAMYKKVTEADIEEFEANYRGSNSEKKDLIELYKKLFCSMLCSDTKLDSHRFKDILDEAIVVVWNLRLLKTIILTRLLSEITLGVSGQQGGGLKELKSNHFQQGS
ncbi:hypothetical protein UlMin_006496 [Ulmus minor]